MRSWEFPIDAHLSQVTVGAQCRRLMKRVRGTHQSIPKCVWALWELCDQYILQSYIKTHQKRAEDSISLLCSWTPWSIHFVHQKTTDLKSSISILSPPVFPPQPGAKKNQRSCCQLPRAASSTFHQWRTMRDTTWASVLAQLRCQQHVTWRPHGLSWSCMNPRWVH